MGDRRRTFEDLKTKRLQKVKDFYPFVRFLAVQESSISDIVGRLVCQSQLTIRA